MIVITRKLSGTTDKALLLWHTVGAGLLGAVVSPFAWTPPGARDYALLALLGVAAMFAHLCMNRSLKLAAAATVAPMQYSLLLWAALLGYLVFGDVPTARTIAGAAIIAGAGLFILWRERAAKARRMN
jgi:drug/metabolite transporter (DMT)-like permease